MTNIKRGEIYYCDFGQANLRGSEQKGKRPVLVIQNNTGNRYSPTVIVASITTKPKKQLPTHVLLQGYNSLTKDCTVLLEQQRTVDKSRLKEYLTCLNAHDMQEVNKAIVVSLGL